jgi:hypothetical protein
MQAVCSFGDIHCLTRYTPELVLQQALSLVQKNISHQPMAVGQAIISDQPDKI